MQVGTEILFIYYLLDIPLGVCLSILLNHVALNHLLFSQSYCNPRFLDSCLMLQEIDGLDF